MIAICALILLLVNICGGSVSEISMAYESLEPNLKSIIQLTRRIDDEQINLDIVFSQPINITEALYGTVLSFQFVRQIVNTACAFQVCPVCGGSKTIHAEEMSPRASRSLSHPCFMCARRGLARRRGRNNCKAVGRICRLECGGS